MDRTDLGTVMKNADPWRLSALDVSYPHVTTVCMHLCMQHAHKVVHVCTHAVWLGHYTHNSLNREVKGQ